MSSIYFPKLSDAELLEYKALKAKLREGYVMVSTEGTLLPSFPDYRIADVVYLEVPHTLKKIGRRDA